MNWEEKFELSNNLELFFFSFFQDSPNPISRKDEAKANFIRRVKKKNKKVKTEKAEREKGISENWFQTCWCPSSDVLSRWRVVRETTIWRTFTVYFRQEKTVFTDVPFRFWYDFTIVKERSRNLPAVPGKEKIQQAPTIFDFILIRKNLHNTNYS